MTTAAEVTTEAARANRPGTRGTIDAVILERGTRRIMKSTIFATVLVVGGVLIVLGQAQDNAKSGPGVQAPRDPGYAALIQTCKAPPPARGGGGAPKGGAPKGAPQGKGPGG